MQWIFWYDWALMPFYFLLLVAIVFRFGKKRYTGSKLKYFKYGFIAKLIGGLGFAIYHQYIFGGGDTALYFDTGRRIAGFASTDFAKYTDLIFSYSKDNLNLRFDTLDDIVFSDSNFFIARISAFFMFFAFKAYIPLVLIFASISYIGIWYAYSSLTKLYPLLQKELAIVFLFIPSVLLWGSGLGKDSLTLGATCLVFGGLIRLFLLPGQKKIINILYVIAGFYIVLMIKPYIIYSFILCFIFGILFQKAVLIKSAAVKVIATPLIIIIAVIGSIGAYKYISADPDFGLDLIADKVLRNNSNLANAEKAGSSYDLGINTNDINGFSDILPIFPKSIFVTLFRPFLWEVSNPAMLLSAIESFLFFIVFLYAIFKNKIFGIFSVLVRNPLAISCLLYTLIFAGLVGISSGNFGTLVRYKIPCVPFFGLFLILVLQKKQLQAK